MKTIYTSSKEFYLKPEVSTFTSLISNITLQKNKIEHYGQPLSYLSEIGSNDSLGEKRFQSTFNSQATF